MSRVILNGDRIVKHTSNPNLGTEVGYIPNDIGLERLRWNGYKLIDLDDLDEIYVDRITKTLHIEEGQNRELVQMKYKDRKHLIIDKNTKKLRVKTQDEIDKPKLEEYKARRKNEYPSIGDQLDVIMKYLKNKSDLIPELEQIINKIDAVKNKWPKPIGEQINVK